MREQSHIDDMRAAIKGDLERARQRRPSVFERPAAPPTAPDPESTADPEVTLGPASPPEPTVQEPEVAPAAATEPASAALRHRLLRLLGSPPRLGSASTRRARRPRRRRRPS